MATTSLPRSWSAAACRVSSEAHRACKDERDGLALHWRRKAVALAAKGVEKGREEAHALWVLSE